MTDMNSDFLLFTIETGFSVNIANGIATLTHSNGTTITFNDRYAILEEPLGQAACRHYYADLMDKFSKLYEIRWYDGDIAMREFDVDITNGSDNASDDTVTSVIFNHRSHMSI